MSEGQNQEQIIAALIESNDILQGELEVIRNSNRMLRRVNSILRKAVESLRNQVAIAHENDERFKQLCNGEFDVVGTGEGEGGLPEPLSMAEPTV